MPQTYYNANNVLFKTFLIFYALLSHKVWFPTAFMSPGSMFVLIFWYFDIREVLCLLLFMDSGHSFFIITVASQEHYGVSTHRQLLAPYTNMD